MVQRMLKYLSVIFAIFKRDLLRIVRNPIALILIIGACALPSAYAWYCTATNWEPYQETAGIRIAVSNEDRGASTVETGPINVGDEVVEKLKSNHELGWAFYDSQEEAINSVYAGESYAAIVIPQDFSSDFTSVLTGDFRHPQIDYYLNEKISAAAPDFTNEGAGVVQDEINQNFVDTVSQTVFDITQKYGHYTEDKAEGAASGLAFGVLQAHTAIGQARSALNDTQPALQTMIDASHKADETLGNMKNTLPQLESALNQARTTLVEARVSAADYSNKLQTALNEGAINIGKAASEASSAIAKSEADLRKVSGETSAALGEAKGIVSQNNMLIAQLENMVAANSALSAQLDPMINNLKSANEELGKTIDSLQSANTALNNTFQGIDNALLVLNAEAITGSREISAASAKVHSEVMPAISSSLDDYADALGTLSGLVVALEPSVDQARASLQGLATSLAQSKNAANDASESLSLIQGRLDTMLTDLQGLTSSATAKKLSEFLKIDSKQAASFISAPVKLETNTVYPVKNYGSGVVSFFTSVALWVAGFVFIDLLKLRVRRDDLPPFTQSQAYFGRWLLFMFLGILPPLIVCTGDLILGIQCENPAAFIFAGLVSGLVYVNIIYAFAQAFRYIGKALAVLFLIVQIPGSSGLYPIEMMPGFYQAIHPLLPFTYTIDAFREAIGGFYGMNYLIDLLVLVVIFVPVGLFVGLVLGRWASNLTLMLDREIGRTGLFDGEEVPKELTPRLSTLLKALLQTPEYRARLMSRVKSFQARFPKLRALGWFLLAAQFIGTFAVMILLEADVNTKLVLLMIAVAGIVVVDVYLIVIAYMKVNLSSQLSLANLSGEQLTDKARQLFKDRSSSDGAPESGASS